MCSSLVSHVLRLTKNCLSFDFIGSSTDESSDDMNSVQIPTSWRPAFLDANTLKLFFDLYQILPNGLASYSLACLVQVNMNVLIHIFHTLITLSNFLMDPSKAFPVRFDKNIS